MPFEVQWHDDQSAPKESPADAAIDESLLSDDLLELAEQLGDDARRLQSCYPAEMTARAKVAPSQASPAEVPAVQSSSKKRRRSSAFVLGGGAACLLIASFALFAAWQTSSPGKTDPGATASTHEASDSFLASHNQPEGAGRVSNAGLDAADADSLDSRINTTSTPALIGIGNATGPQLEAFYDYLEDEDQTVRLSI